MDDDDDTKARRNLLVVCTLVVVVWFLQLPTASLAKKLLGLEGDELIQVSPFRVWLSIGTAIAYFAHRFLFSESTDKAWQVLKADWRQQCINTGTAIVQREAERFSPAGRESLVFHNEMQTHSRRLFGENEGGDGVAPWPSISVLDVSFEGKPYELAIGQANIGLSEPGNRTSNISVGIQLIGRYRALQLTRAALKVIFYSRSTTDFIVPLLALACAATICLVRLLVHGF